MQADTATTPATEPPAAPAFAVGDRVRILWPTSVFHGQPAKVLQVIDGKVPVVEIELGDLGATTWVSVAWLSRWSEPASEMEAARG